MVPPSSALWDVPLCVAKSDEDIPKDLLSVSCELHNTLPIRPKEALFSSTPPVLSLMSV
jgi:hypothetical protein